MGFFHLQVHRELGLLNNPKPNPKISGKARRTLRRLPAPRLMLDKTLSAPRDDALTNPKLPTVAIESARFNPRFCADHGEAPSLILLCATRLPRPIVVTRAMSTMSTPGTNSAPTATAVPMSPMCFATADAAALAIEARFVSLSRAALAFFMHAARPFELVHGLNPN